ncbi:MAG: hypothetical protein M1833_001215 [Piccolia ochrophora]|nr:MAG: hypothetical protein M1833_001215 [Piccolia ochrophora]
MPSASIVDHGLLGGGNDAGLATFRGTEGAYMLPHHVKEIERLNRQHRFMSSTTEGVLIAAPLGDSDPVRVLDAGCADGTWLRDLTRQFPSKQLSLHGIDIGSTLFPPSDARLPALDLRQHDLTEPISGSWHWDSSFDVIHQRLLIWGLKTTQWPIVLRNHLAILKPGGYLQLVEAEWIDPATRHLQSPLLQKQAHLQEWSTLQFGMDINIAFKLEDLLREVGFVDVNTVQFQHGYGAKAKDKTQGNVSAELWVECFRTLDSKIGVGSNLAEEGIPNVAKDAAEFHAFLDDLEKEIKDNGYQPKLNMVYGRRPLD